MSATSGQQQQRDRRASDLMQHQARRTSTSISSLAVGEVDDVHQAEDQAQPRGHQRVDQAHQQAADDRLEDEGCHILKRRRMTRCPPSPARGRCRRKAATDQVSAPSVLARPPFSVAEEGATRLLPHPSRPFGPSHPSRPGERANAGASLIPPRSRPDLLGKPQPARPCGRRPDRSAESRGCRGYSGRSASKLHALSTA